MSDEYPNRIAELRNAAGLTQSELAAVAGIDPARLSRWETGKHRPYVDGALRLAAVLGVTLEELFRGAARPPDESEDLRRRPNQIQTLREAKGLTTIELAERVGVPAYQVRRWEAGVGVERLRAVHAVLLAQALGVRVTDLGIRAVEPATAAS